jgi:hypothetical protein
MDRRHRQVRRHHRRQPLSGCNDCADLIRLFGLDERQLATPLSIQSQKQGDDLIEVLTTKDIPYFITAPTFETSSEKYGWLNSVQRVNKMVELKLGEGGYVKYDIYVLR